MHQICVTSFQNYFVEHKSYHWDYENSAYKRGYTLSGDGLMLRDGLKWIYLTVVIYTKLSENLPILI